MRPLPLPLSLATVLLALVACDAPVPRSVLLHEEVHGPTMYVDNVRYGGFNPCAFVKRVIKDGSYWTLPADLGGEETCFTHLETCRKGECATTRRLLVAYGGYCATGVRDKTGPHFTTPLNPRATLTTYAGGLKVIELNHYLKAFATTDRADEEAAQAYYRTEYPSKTDFRALNVPLFADIQRAFIPARKAGR